MRSILALAAAALLLAGCSTLSGLFGGQRLDLTPSMPSDFLCSFVVREAAQPPVDYTVKIQRNGQATFETVVRAPTRAEHAGEFQVGEEALVGLYAAVRESGFAALASRYGTADAPPGPGRDLGARVFYVYANGGEKRIDVQYVSVPQLDELERRIAAVIPSYVSTGSGVPAGPQALPAVFVADRRTRYFHRPDCELCKQIAPADQSTYPPDYSAVNEGFHPCPTCRPLDSLSSN